jgi:hypothetical protein
MKQTEKEALRNLLEIEIRAGRVVPVEIVNDQDVVLEYSKASEHALVCVLKDFGSFDLVGVVENALQFGCAEQVHDVARMVYHHISGAPHGELPLHLLFNALVKEVTSIMLEEIKEDVFSKKELAQLATLSPAWEALSEEYERTIAEDND